MSRINPTTAATNAARPVPKVHYKFQTCPRDPAHWVELFTAGAAVVPGRITIASIPTVSAKVLESWRHRVRSLVSAGWETDSPHRFDERRRIMMNCRPCGARTTPKALTCCYFLCPQCWSRRAAAFWQSINDNLFADQVQPDAEPTCYNGKIYRAKPPRGARCSYDVLMVERTYAVPVDVLDGPWDEPISGLAQFLAWRNAPRTQRKQWHPLCRERERERCKYIGMVEAILPQWRRSSPDWWSVRLRQLIVVRPGDELKLQPIYQEPMAVRRLKRPRRAAVLRATGWLCRYPRWLLNCPPLMALRFEQDRAGRRLWTTGGLFLGKSRPVRVD